MLPSLGVAVLAHSVEFPMLDIVVTMRWDASESDMLRPPAWCRVGTDRAAEPQEFER
jgi:hypothetical protein